MGIDEDIARTRAAVDLVMIIGEHTEIKRSGRNWMARCPIHGEKRHRCRSASRRASTTASGVGRAATRYLRSGNGESRLRRSGGILAGRYGIQLRYVCRRGPASRLQEGPARGGGQGGRLLPRAPLSGKDSAEARAICAAAATTGSLSVVTRSAGRPTIGISSPAIWLSADDLAFGARVRQQSRSPAGRLPGSRDVPDP